MNSRHKTSLILFGIIFLSGCINIPGFGSGGGGAGLSISKLEAIPSTVGPGEPISVLMTLKNDGSDTARNVIAELQGLTTEWGISPARVQATPDIPGATKSGTTSIPGEERDISWTLYGPSKSVELPYDVKAQISYLYTSNLEGQIKAVTTDYLRMKNDRGGVTSASSSGPIKISMSVPSTVMSTPRVSVQFTFSNSGKGRVHSVSGGGSESLDFLFVSVNGAYCPVSLVHLSGGSSGTIRCYVDTSGVAGFGVFSVSVSTTYLYTMDQDFKVTIQPRSI